MYQMFPTASTIIKFCGPGFIVAVGYLDPGNWATDLAAGSSFGYSLLIVILCSSFCATLLQYLSMKLGLVTNLDLAQLCRSFFNPKLNFILYIFAELSIMACDLAEVIGSAIALNLLFNLDIKWGVLITGNHSSNVGFDVFVILAFWNTKRASIYEIFITSLVLTVAISLLILVGVSKPNWIDLFTGFIPSQVLIQKDALYIAIGILGATVMPHNLYLHSSTVKHYSPREKEIEDDQDQNLKLNEFQETEWLSSSAKSKMANLKRCITLSAFATVFCLFIAFLVNASILIVSSANFYKPNEKSETVADLKDAFNLISTYLGKGFGILFAIALLASGQSSTITGMID